MKTIIESVDQEKLNEESGRIVIRQAGEIIRNGGLVAFPTETVYGLGANALDEQAAAKVYAAKGRPSDNPLIAHIADLDMLYDIVSDVPDVAKKLMKAFWPGPMTLIFHKSPLIPKGTTGGLDTVAVRYPSHPIALAIIKEAGVGIAAPSANLSGKPSPTMGEHVIDDMNGRIDMIIDGGMVGMGLESTIIDVTVTPPMILRPGFVTYEMVKDAIGEVNVDKTIFEKPSDDLKPKAPGMKYRHYAPEADYRIYRGQAEKVAEKIIMLANEKSDNGEKTGVITVEQHLNLYEGKLNRDIMVVSLGSMDKPETIANKLFKVLRDFDKAGTKFIFGEAFSQDNVGWAIMNRLTKAAGYNIIDV